MRALVLAGCLLAVGCTTTGTGLARCQSGDSSVVCARLGEPFDIRVGQTAYIADTRFSLDVTGIPEDSRCPSDAVCVWAGNARVALVLRDGNAEREDAVNSFVEPRAAEHAGYRVMLDAVSPVPVSSRSISQAAYVVRLRVTRAGA